MEKGRVYTNRKEFQDIGRIEEHLKKIQTMGKYVIIEPELKDFKSTLPATAVSQIKHTTNRTMADIPRIRTPLTKGPSGFSQNQNPSDLLSEGF